LLFAFEPVSVVSSVGRARSMPAPEVITSFAAIAAVASAVAAFLSYRRERQWAHADTFLRIVERLDSDVSRRRRQHVNYELAELEWTASDREDVRTLCADLDLVGVLLSNERDLRPFLEMYGDTVLRSVWVLAPYLNRQRDERGEKFLLCLSRLVARLVAQWRTLAERHEFPEEIGFPDREQYERPYEVKKRNDRDVKELTPDTFKGDPEIQRFLEVVEHFQPLGWRSRVRWRLRRGVRMRATNLGTGYRASGHLHDDVRARPAR
jgi:hypothetical protein